jgi:DNA invertase Pin-like site-specific DNA recombinase
MRLGYIRIDRAGPSRNEQEAALRLAGVEDFTPDGPVYVDAAPKKRAQPGADATPARTEAVRALREGDELAIHSAGRLGTTRDDVLRALEGVTAAGGAVWDCEAGQAVRWHPDARIAIAFAERAESQGKRQRAANARKGITRRPGRSPALTQAQQKRAKDLWANPETTARQVADATGASERTLYRLFGPKGTPLFGRKSGK